MAEVLDKIIIFYFGGLYKHWEVGVHVSAQYSLTIQNTFARQT